MRAIIWLPLLLTACGLLGEEPPRTMAKSTLPPPPIPAAHVDNSDIKVRGIEIQNAHLTKDSAQVYFTMESIGPDDRLLAVHSSAAREVIFHHDESNGSMKPLEFIYVHPHNPSKMTGEYHVMLVGLTKPLAKGNRVPLTLDFEKIGTLHTEAIVR